MRESPRYLIFRPRKGGVAAYFAVPKRLRPEGWPATYALGPVSSEADKDGVVQKARELAEKLDRERLGERRGPNPGSIPHLIRLLEADPAGLYRWKSLSESSRRTYAQAFKVLRKWSASANHPPAAHMTPQGVHKLYAQLGERPHMRKLVAAALSKLLDVAIMEGLISRNILREMPAPPARTPEANRENIWPDEYFEACLERAMERQEWSLARAIAFQRYHAQRPSDALRLHTEWIKDGRLEFRQQKTGALVRIPLDSAFVAVLDRTPAQIGPLTLNGERPYTQTRYRQAIYRLEDALGLPRRPPKFLRHTGVLEMARTPLTALEISQRTGHSPGNIAYILRHYLPQDDDLKEAASAKLEAYRKNASRTDKLNAVERLGENKGGKSR